MGEGESESGEEEQEARCNGEVENFTPPFFIPTEDEVWEIQPPRRAGEAPLPFDLRMRRMT